MQMSGREILKYKGDEMADLWQLTERNSRPFYFLKACLIESMKLFDIFTILSLVAVINFMPISASPVEDQTASPSSSQVGSGVAPIFAQFFAGVISAVEQLSPDAAQDVTAGVQQACSSVKSLDTSSANVAEVTPASYLSSIAGAFNSFVSSALPTLSPFFIAILGVVTGDASASPAIVAVAQQTCDLVFNGPEAT